MLVQSCPAAELQQLCDTVKQGLVLVNGHSFLIGQVGKPRLACAHSTMHALRIMCWRLTGLFVAK